MNISFTDRKRMRKSFGRIREVAEMPNLIEVQRNSYESFLQHEVHYKDRLDMGLQSVFNSVFPIRDSQGRAQLDFLHYELETPKYDLEECMQRGMTFAAPLKVTLNLTVWDLDVETGARSLRETKEQAVYMGDMPLMTDKGTFIFNGTERVIVSQMHRSPGVFFDHDDGKTHISAKYLFSARIIPYRGSWLDFEFDAKDNVYVRIDRRRKLPATTILFALDSAATEALRVERGAKGVLEPHEVHGMSTEEILNHYYEQVQFERTERGWRTEFRPEQFRGTVIAYDLINAESGELLVKAGDKLIVKNAQKLKTEGLKYIIQPREELFGKFSANDIINEMTGEIYLEAGAELTDETLANLEANGINNLSTLLIDYIQVGPYIRNTLMIDKNDSREKALEEIYRVMRPGEPHTQIETTETMFRDLFFNLERYDLSSVGRVKMNARLNRTVPDSVRILQKGDILAILKLLVGLKDGRGEKDDIDHLGNRRVRSVGELLENSYRLGLLRMERSIKERLNSIEIDRIMPNDLINAKPAAAAVREFFGSSQLSQFMDQTNPLAEITHKRRLSALGPGGLTRERAGPEVRDVHPTHYGRICPIETPEGPNIGLINSLSTYARVNRYGFIEAPYRKINNGRVTDEVVYLSAIEEGKFIVAQANAELNANGEFVDEQINCRHGGDYIMAFPKDINLIDVSPRQLVSVAAALIPFLENDDANRALMGSNMQRQAVPLVRAEAPLVGTGMEARVARDSGVTIVAKRAGVVNQVDATRIVISAKDQMETTKSGVDIYNLLKFQRSNQSTCITQRPLVKVGDVIAAGDIIADGPSTELGELALGRNVLCAFMPWNGYNFEDSILISERIVSDDVFTSIHIEQFEVMTRDTKLGPEEITRDIPNVGEDALKNLDEAGIVYIGAEVKAGDILVGKVTPKGESPMTPEEKLLRAIFNEKSSDVRDSSMRVPSGVSGTVAAVRVFSRRGIEKDERALAIDRQEIERLAKDRDDERAILERSFHGRLREALMGKDVTTGPKGTKIGKQVTEEVLSKLTPGQWRQIGVADDKVADYIEALKKQFDESLDRLQRRFEDRREKLQRGDELPPGVMKQVKVYVADKRKLQPGDKMAGRHGNKGVISRIIPLEDMPYLEDGTPVDLVLNPLGVPSRMNIGQILETHLGWASAGLGRQVREVLDNLPKASDMKPVRETLKNIYGDKDFNQNIKPLGDVEVRELATNLTKGIPFASPVFDGARAEDIVAVLRKAGLHDSGQVTLIDGRTGEPFDRQVTVGYIYMLKLHHLVDDKIHARSIGPYSLVTQQPLGGKAQSGGQRFGEMEVWALEGYGAAYTLQEMLTIKSDDVSGRSKVYESIANGQERFQAGIPESFNVLVKEIKSLGLNIELNQSSRTTLPPATE